MEKTKTLKKDWVLTADAFALLLTALNPDPELAGIKYEQIRRKIIRKLEFEGSSEPEEHADEVFNRVARRVTEGEQLDAETPDGYFLQTARFVLSESRRAGKTHRVSGLDDLAAGEEPSFNPVEETERLEERIRRELGLGAIEKCRQELPAEERRIYDVYEYGSGRERIERRQKLAAELGEKIENLRLVVCRIGKKLTKCAEKQIEKSKRKL